MTRLNRRRFLTLAASAAALPGYAGTGQTAYWRGTALGASATMQLEGLTQEAANPVFAAVEAELLRLENVFSLYRPGSQISQLNLNGEITTPSPELLEVLSLSASLHRASGGVFDPTVQPLWLASAEGKGMRRARAAVGWSKLRVDPKRIAFSEPGMGLTLNGIAQGAITDKIAALLRTYGLRDVLLDTGEVAAFGRKSDGSFWNAGISDPDGKVRHRIILQDRALATSAPVFAMPGNEQVSRHILRPNGEQALRKLVSVSAPTAALADGLSTAACLLSDQGLTSLMAEFPAANLERVV
ncbi:FAD:protein FMN transferase [Primorskyibacter sp. S87]|uniref:FAD:protein FMN transferase n=1 Tax=Primorskyibacter sp. S87 TaxID=3415126 RepID=UPI003C79EE10